MGGDLNQEKAFITRVTATQRLYYLTNASRNVTAITDASGNVLERYVYDPYGNVTIYDPTMTQVRAESLYANNILFAGYRYDTETGLYEVRNRYYDPNLSRFISNDPIGYADGMNMYAYGRGAPAGGTDPFGLLTINDVMNSGDQELIDSVRDSTDVQAELHLYKNIDHLRTSVLRVHAGSCGSSSGGAQTDPASIINSVTSSRSTILNQGDAIQAQIFNHEYVTQKPVPLSAEAIARTHAVMRIVGGVSAIIMGGGTSWAGGVVLAVWGADQIATGLSVLTSDSPGDTSSTTTGLAINWSAEASGANYVTNGWAGPTGEILWEIGPSPWLKFGGPHAPNRGLSTAAKGELGEAAASRTLQRAGYEQLPSKLSRNNGIDGVFVRRGAGGQIDDIIVVESKFSSTGRAYLTNTKTMGKQLSTRWMNANIQKMLNSADPGVRRAGMLLDANRSLIRTKANVLDAAGRNRWNRIKIPE